MPASNATSRFSDRVENYVRYRPGYPPEVLRCSEERVWLGAQPCGRRHRLGHRHLDSHAAGEWQSRLRSRAQCRDAQGGRASAGGFPKFTSVAGTAEATTLADHSVDFVTAAQAAHWFDRERARREFVRILKPGGWLVLLWNERLTDSTAFLRDYEQLLLTYGTDYEDVRHERTTDAVNEFFDPAPFQERVFEMRQEFDYAGLEGRLLSSSYAPGPEHPKHAPMLRELAADL